MSESMQTRNYGIDICRILSMFMVVGLHVMQGGGIISSTSSSSPQYYVVWLIDVFFYGAVNLFGMISGYTQINKTRIGFEKILSLWFLVLFYSVLVTVIIKFIPICGERHTVSSRDLLHSFLPVISVRYWYFSAYFGLYFFIPYFNKLINSLNKREHIKLCLLIITIFTIIPTLNLHSKDCFGLCFGYSVIWLISLYILGAYIKRFPICYKKLRCIILYLIFSILAWSSIFIQNFIYQSIYSRLPNNYVLIDYTSPLILFASIYLLVFFPQVTIYGNLCRKIIKYISSISFSVYLIHKQPIFYDIFWINKFSDVSNNTCFVLLIKILCISLCVFVCCLVLDTISERLT